MRSTICRRRLPGDARALAQWLIGKSLVRRLGRSIMSGRIVETEAYLADDRASHSFAGQTARNKSMFLQRGHAYIYRIYGMHCCLNVSAGNEGEGAAVLIRSLEPVDGVALMQKRRAGAPLRDFARGPGRLCTALAIDQRLDGADLCVPGALELAYGDATAIQIGVSTRIGVTHASDARLRFFERNNVFVSGPRLLKM
jgi:DNA-3-methyladenine glycosylase